MVIYGNYYRLSKKSYRLDNLLHKRGKICYHILKESETREGGITHGKDIWKNGSKSYNDFS